MASMALSKVSLNEKSEARWLFYCSTSLVLYSSDLEGHHLLSSGVGMTNAHKIARSVLACREMWGQIGVKSIVRDALKEILGEMGGKRANGGRKE